MFRALRLCLEVLALGVLALAARCANSGDVFVGGRIYFTDADCYSRMTRVRLCFEHPGLVIRHHAFENFPAGTTPHSTALFDYLVVGLAELLRPLTGRPLELAGAWISPLLGLAGALFLWWWLRRMNFAFRLAALLLFAVSPIVVHATELGRPDHQSLLLVLLLFALCAEWILRIEWSKRWSVASGISWALALWVSLYEPLIMFSVVMVCRLIIDWRDVFSLRWRPAWLAFAFTVSVGCLVERRPLSVPWPNDQSAMANWLSVIGEMQPVALSSRSWIEWCGYFLVIAPIFAVIASRRRALPPAIVLAALLATFGLTLLQVRWACYFVAVLCLVVPALLSSVRGSRALIWVGLALSALPLLQAWDEILWPPEKPLGEQLERRREMVDLRAAAAEMKRIEGTSFLAPWWLSPALAYWSGEPGVSGSSHEALEGIADSARFFGQTDAAKARQIAALHRVAYVVSYDSGRLVADSEAICGGNLPDGIPLAEVLDRRPSTAPSFLRPIFANGTCKLFQTEISDQNEGFP